MKRIASVLSLSVFLFLQVAATPIPQSSSQRLDMETLLNNTAPSVVKITPTTRSDTGGTGFQIRSASGRSYIVTNNHICQMGQKLAIYTDGSKTPVIREVIETDPKKDLCIVEGISSMPTLNIAPSAAGYRSPVYLVGHPRLEETQITQGFNLGVQTISLLDRKWQPGKKCENKLIEVDSIFGKYAVCVVEFEANFTDARAFPGNSGSPMIDGRGDVTGVLFAGDNETQKGFYVQWKDLKAMLDRY